MAKKAVLNKRQKEFCERFVMKNESPTQAYKAVYTDSKLRSASTIANRLLRKPHIQSYIEFLKETQQTELKKRIGYNAEVCFDELTEIQKVSTSACDFKTAVKCVEIKAKLYGLLIDKTESDVKYKEPVEVIIKGLNDNADTPT